MRKPSTFSESTGDHGTISLSTPRVISTASPKTSRHCFLPVGRPGKTESGQKRSHLHHMNDTRRHNDGRGARGGVAIDGAGNLIWEASYSIRWIRARDGLYHLILTAQSGTKVSCTIFKEARTEVRQRDKLFLGWTAILCGVTQGGGGSGCGNGGCGTVFEIAP